MVINGSETEDDAYIIPYAVGKTVFAESAVDNKNRWSGRIAGTTLFVRGKTLNVASFHNAFKLLDVAAHTAVTLDAADETTNETPSSVDDALETTLHLESDLENFLLADLNQLELGLRLFDVNGVLGRQISAGAAGRIDLLTVDANGDLVVIEVKAGEADRQVCGQIQAYMGWVAGSLAGPRKVRGIIVASGFTERLKLAAKVMPSLSLKYYSVVFRFRDG